MVLVLAGRVATDWWPNPQGGGARYTYLPLVLTLCAFGWLRAGTTWQVGRAVALALYLCPLAASFAAWTAPPLAQFHWPQQVREVQAGTRTRFEIPPNHSFAVPQRGHPRIGPSFTPIQ